MLRSFTLFFLLLIGCQVDKTTQTTVSTIEGQPVSTEVTGVYAGADQLPLYVPKLKGKSCGLVVNQSSLVANEHLVDTLRALNVSIARIFVPEHGFRGTADAGAEIKDGQDSHTGLSIVSLYGKNKKPAPESMEDLDVMIFDLQDVGVRCYTYISTLHYVMEACAESGIPLIVLDRPNPNAHYIDGPVLEEDFQSFVGMHPVPLVYGMTIGEYAKMIKGEEWINKANELHLEVIPCHGYDHQDRYVLPIAPSPNLRTERSVLLYPSLVLFEGTAVSVGRGTEHPFEVYGHPSFAERSFAFTPKPSPGASNPKLNGQTCLGTSFVEQDPMQVRRNPQIQIEHVVNAYKMARDKESFFLENGFFNKLAGTDQLQRMIREGKHADTIRQSWQQGLDVFRDVRSRYLIYSDESEM